MAAKARSRDFAASRENDADSYGLGKIASWIGSPFGPDAIGGQFTAEYDVPLKYKAGFSYLFVAHGRNSVGLFDMKNPNGGYDYFYPSAIYLQDKELDRKDSAEKTRAMRTLSLTPTVQYTNRISLSGEYYFMKNLSAGAEGSYTFVFNNKGRGGEFAHGFELSLNAKYSLF